jgi:hypothetical protein
MSSETSSVPESNWVKIPLRADEPAHCALFKHFLKENRFPFMENAEHISVLKADADRLSAALEIWAFSADMPDDERSVETLNALLREIGNIVLEGLDGTSTLPRAVNNGIDLR